MSKTKRYYWIKLRESFLTSDAVDFLMSQKNGAQYVVLYQMLCLKTANTDGQLARKIGEVLLKYDIEKIQRDTKYFDVDTIRVALELYKNLGLVYEGNDKILQIANFDKMIGSETKWAKYKRVERDKEETKKLDNVQNMSNKILEIRDRDKDIDKDIRLKDKELKNKDKEKDLKTSPEPIKNRSKLVAKIILNDKSFYEVTEEEVKYYQNLYPGVDVHSQINKMVGWCDSNYTRRKTKRGIKAFMNNWLSKQQDQAPRVEKKETKIVKEEKKEPTKTKKEKKEMSEKRKHYQKLLEEEEF